MSCSSPEKENGIQQPINPPAPGFNAEASDSVAITIADSVMVAMGGRSAWDNLHFVSWNFFGVRDLLWDKQTGRVRIDIPATDETYLINVNDETGSVYAGDSLISPADSLRMKIGMGKSIWINDSYWLFMPFKLKDSGVTLKYAGEDMLPDGSPAQVLELTFSDVGDTPENKYRVYVDRQDHLVRQWAYFRSSQQDSATAVWPWDNYARYGDLLLSADRSDNRGPKNVRVYDSIPDAVFEDPDFDLSTLRNPE